MLNKEAVTTTLEQIASVSILEKKHEFNKLILNLWRIEAGFE